MFILIILSSSYTFLAHLFTGAKFPVLSLFHLVPLPFLHYRAKQTCQSLALHLFNSSVYLDKVEVANLPTNKAV